MLRVATRPSILTVITVTSRKQIVESSCYRLTSPPRSSEAGDSGDYLDLAISGLQSRETREIGLVWRSQFSREPSWSYAPRSPEPGDSGDWPDLAIIPGLQK
ncbi:hypothetical protein VE03_00845 [Pseudogymnoascus sp. 23342-1-I1]|nr:hypothetical protein VE03_00845 [Pseudogymnoascus sp. 23342-1-I1]